MKITITKTNQELTTYKPTEVEITHEYRREALEYAIRAGATLTEVVPLADEIEDYLRHGK